MHVEPATLGCHKIILDEDPQRPVESLSDEDDEDGATGDGLGEEDAEPNEGDEDDDELDGDGEQLESNGDGDPPCKRTSARLPMPGWLSEPFKAHVAECGPTFRDAKGRPPLYSIHHTFWFPQHSTFFFLDRDDPPPPQQLFNPRFFLWDPDALCTGIPCPNCRTSLQRHQPISRPRRCVDFNSTFWIIGYRYRCGRCLHPKSGKRTVTFRSWDPRILAVLSPTLAHEFPAQLSHRSGLSKTLFSWMRSCFNYGMGSKQFSDALRAEHILSHDLLELQYLESLAERSLKPWLQQEKWEAFPRYDDHGPLGPHLYTPCSTLCRDVYDGFMEDHRDEINQHTAMLTGEICAIDHSHKITKETVRVNGEQIFIGTLTVTNEKNQIRVCCFVATKSHSQYELALNRMRESLSLYGHSQPSLFYTDNMLDKKFLEDCFPSLRENVIPVEKYGHLEELKVPPEISIFIKNTRDTINDAMRTILDDVPQDDGVIVIGLGSEWNVKVNSQGKVLRKGRTAVVQIAYENRIYILQVADMLAEGSLPQQLKLLLSHPRILKAGRLVNTDLGYLQAACHSETPFVGGLDLAKSAKERRIISSTQCSLADLSAIILNKRLNKNVPERISPAWEDATLTQQQLDYASRDVYASLLIYRHLSTLDVPQRLGPSLTPSKGVPARESRTGARLVSPGFGREKKIGHLYNMGSGHEIKYI
ncbi:hypothetical protein M413DRAFT_59520 [Hebeloma cylindrosporum]|uniref:3'-5' exonuclease n=1 Tax=Hebeloma cylindrosporum TaxID=76867 RepID=A0A0C3CJE5_HEBCY|nr:hypothetical protein M413DRAFT_59520 [Hebeloma cylindrosporum h7]